MRGLRGSDLPQEENTFMIGVKKHKIMSGKDLRIWLALGLGAVLALPALAADQPAAVLAVVAGAVTVERGGDQLDGSFGAALQAGDVVMTGDGAQAAILFESGQILELGPGSRISIGALPSKGGEELAVADAFAGSLDRFTSSGGQASAPLDLRAGPGGERPDPIRPRTTLVTPGVVTFEWEPVEEVLEYRLVVSGPESLAGTYATAEPGWSPSAEVVLAPGERWTWYVEAITPDGSVSSDPVAFEVASEEQVQELEALLGELLPLLESSDPTRTDAANYLLGSYCRNAGFYGDAIEYLQVLVARYPDRKELHRELGAVYQAVGRTDLAAQEYAKALGE
jgi:hypothetical protein